MDEIGRRRRRLSLQAETVMPDGAGGGAAQWIEVAQVFAAVEGIGGNEEDVAMRVAGRTRYRVGLRYRDGVAAGMRFVDGGRVLTIRAAFDPDGTRRRLTCLCEVVP